MSGKRKKSSLDARAAPSKRQRTRSRFSRSSHQKWRWSREKPARSCLGFSCYILSLAIAHSMASSPSSRACRETCWLQLRRIARSEWAILPIQEAAACPRCSVCEHLRKEAGFVGTQSWTPWFCCADKINWKLRRATDVELS